MRRCEKVSEKEVQHEHLQLPIVMACTVGLKGPYFFSDSWTRTLNSYVLNGFSPVMTVSGVSLKSHELLHFFPLLH